MTQSQHPSGGKPAARRAGSVALKPAAPTPEKAGQAANCQALEHIPNIGPSLAEDLRQIGIRHPRDLLNKDAFVLYQQLCAATGQRHDPCVLDTFMAATDFMRGAPAAPWWHYTAHRKALYGQIEGSADSADSGLSGVSGVSDSAGPGADDAANAGVPMGPVMKKSPPP
jgi:hypothetical protein